MAAKDRDDSGLSNISVVIPAYNSGATIEGTVLRLAARLARAGGEILIVENGSTDDTHSRCLRLVKSWSDPSVTLSLMRSEKGLGNALRMGAMASRGSWVLLTADDLPFGFDDLDEADRLFASGQRPGVIVGSKAHPDSVVKRSALRTTLTAAFAVGRRLVLGMRTRDSQGTILVRGDLMRRLIAEAVEPGFLFTTELMYLCERMKVVPVEVPVRLSPDHSSHGSRVAVADVVKMAIGMLRLRRRHRRWPRSMAIDPNWH